MELVSQYFGYTGYSVAGKSDPVDIANEFKSYFDGIYVNSAVNTYAVDEYVKLGYATSVQAVKQIIRPLALKH
jgi:hypothetical protein